MIGAKSFRSSSRTFSGCLTGEYSSSIGSTSLGA